MEQALKIGDFLYRYVRCGGVFEYKVIGIRIYDDQTLYELESQSCTHGWKCKILVGGKIDQLRYVCMTNDEEEDTQHYWHTDDTKFRKIKEEAEIDLINANLAIVKENIRTAEERVTREKASAKKYEDLAKIAKQKIAEKLKGLSDANIPAIS